MQHCFSISCRFDSFDDIDSDTRVALHPADGGYWHDKGTMLLEFTRNVEKRRRKSRSTTVEEYTEKIQKIHESVRFIRSCTTNTSHQLKRTRFEILENNRRNGT